MKLFSQRSIRRRSKILPNSTMTIGEKGCLVCTLAMGDSKFDPRLGKYSTVDEILEGGTFTNKDYEYGPGLWVWGRFEFKNMEFKGRHMSWTSADREMVQLLSGDPDWFVALEVQTKATGERHWVACVGPSNTTWAGFGLASNDPWFGRRLWKTTGMFTPYRRVLGYALFKKKA